MTMLAVKTCQHCNAEFFGYPDIELENCCFCGKETIHTPGEVMPLTAPSVDELIIAMGREITTMKSQIARLENIVRQMSASDR